MILRSAVGRAPTVFALAVGLALSAAPALAQTGTVEGRVTAAATGDPIAGAQVIMVGTNIGARTDADGRYVLLNVATGGQQVRAAAIGYAMMTVQFNVQAGIVNTADFQLNTSVLRLDEVVVTGTAGQARKREVGNTISSINLADVPDPPANLDQMLQARAAGMQVMQTSGMAGSGASIRLRGAVSVNQSNQPLIYIDGVRVRSEGYRRNRPPVGFRGRGGNVEASPLNDINPDDIERVEVIKGSAASTLYGTEASAGVIQIFTKKGRAGAARWSFETGQGFATERSFGTDENPFMNMKPCTEGTSCWDQWTQSKTVGLCSDEGLAIDIHCSWLRNGHRQKYAGSVGGGSDEFQYFVSGGWEDNDGVMLLDNEKKVATRANFSFDLVNNLRVDWNTSYTNNRIANTAAGNNAHGVTLNVFRAERNYFGDSDPNNLRQLLNQEITTEIDRLITGTTINYTPWTWFTNRFTIGYDLAQQENRNLRPFGFVRAPRGILSDEQIKYTTLTTDYAGSINFSLSDAISSTFSVGGQGAVSQLVRTTAYSQDFPGPSEPTVSGGSTFIAREDRERVVNAGFFFQNMFSLNDKLFVTGGLRVDGNSTFGKGLGLQLYPKAQVSYVISDEAFFPEGLGEMKLRGALGLSGRAPGTFDAIRQWDPIPYDGDPAFRPDNVGNDDIGPERTREIEVGVDWAFLNDRISTEFTWFEQKTTDALFDVSQVPSLGFLNAQAANVGAIRNRGIELNLNAAVIDQPDFGLDLGGNVYTNNSMVLSLGDAVPFDAGGDEGDAWVEEGFPVLAGVGILIRNPDVIDEPDTACTVDCNALGEFVFGPQEPTFVLGLNASLRLPKGITISARGEYQRGAYIEDQASGNALSRSVRWPTCANAHGILDGNPVPSGLNEAETTAFLNGVGMTAWERHACIPANHDFEIHWYKQDFFKLRDLTLRIPFGWAIPQLQQATLTITAQNYFRWINDNLRVFDPEMKSRNSLSDQNRSISEHIPPPAIITASVRVNF
jgi:TonB-linked SusC/RagA family outer membrane protein